MKELKIITAEQAHENATNILINDVIFEQLQKIIDEIETESNKGELKITSFSLVGSQIMLKII